MIVSGRVLLSPHQQSGHLRSHQPTLIVLLILAITFIRFQNQDQAQKSINSTCSKNTPYLPDNSKKRLYSCLPLFSNACLRNLQSFIFFRYSGMRALRVSGSSVILQGEREGEMEYKLLAESDQFLTRSRVNRNCVIEVLLRGWGARISGSLPE